ncbi:MAG TPA: glycosyltransferase [Burkholderiales bacterium]|nr:glycosyltransferase [Burkholderiales bacterium]
MRILLTFLSSWREHTFYQDFHRGLGEALRAFGHEPVTFSFQALGEPRQEEAEALFQQLDRGNFSAVLDLCCWGYGLSQITLRMVDGTSQTIFDAFGIPHVGILCDQPYNQALNGIRGARRYAAYPDLGHPEQVRLVFPGFKLTGEMFLPPAVRPANDRSAGKWADRNIDVLYIGNVIPLALERYWNDPKSVHWSKEFDPYFCNALADAALEEPDRSLHLSVQAALAKLGKPPPGFDFNPQFRAVESHLRYVFRRDAVVALARSGVRMRVVGKGWDEIPLPPNVELGDETNYEGFFQLAGQSKICLDASTYLDGVNDRAFSYLLSGAVCFTNAAGYLRSALGEADGMRFYSMRNLPELGEQVRKLLARPDDLRAAGQRGREVVLASHTWQNRIDGLLQLIQPKSGFMTGVLPPPPTRRY